MRKLNVDEVFGKPLPNIVAKQFAHFLKYMANIFLCIYNSSIISETRSDIDKRMDTTNCADQNIYGI